ncbi:MAG: thiamine phosphate synthase [Acidobacteriota bacterium]|nr:thiamine phosphate synthase [Acidobacteriota bacterium]
MLIGNLNSRVYYVTPEQTEPNGRLVRLVDAAISSGIGLLQFRPKRLTTRQMVEQATVLVSMTRRAQVPLIINDRVDLALAVGADGVHLGAEDMPVGHARRLLGPAAIIGATCVTPMDARVAETDGATYVLVGPVGDLSGEAGELGLERVRQVRKATGLPVCVHGDVTVEGLHQLRALGVEMICVADPDGEVETVTRKLQDTVAMALEHLAPRHVAP